MKKFMRFALTAGMFIGTIVSVSAWDKATESELEAVMRRNISAMEKEDVDMAVADLDDSKKEATRAMVKEIFAKYDLKCRILSFKVVGISGDTAEVEVSQEIRKVSGPAFQDQILKAVHTLQKRPSGWKITESRIISVQKL